MAFYSFTVTHFRHRCTNQDAVSTHTLSLALPAIKTKPGTAGVDGEAWLVLPHVKLSLRMEQLIY